MNVKLHKDIFIAFFRSGMLGYGGGPSTIPLVHKEVVDTYKWMNDEEFSDVLALGNTLPGPIATKMAGYIGYRVGGVSGLINALMASVMPTVLLMILLIGFLSSFRESTIVQGMTQAVAPVVGVMLAVLAYNFFRQSQKGLGVSGALIIALVSVIAFELLNIHPVIIIVLLLLYGLLKRPSEEGSHNSSTKGPSADQANLEASQTEQDESLERDKNAEQDKKSKWEGDAP